MTNPSIDRSRSDANPSGSSASEKWAELKIINDSSKVLAEIRYSGGKVYYTEAGQLSVLTDLKPGQACVVKTYETASGSIHFKIGAKNIKTQQRYDIDMGKEKSVTISDNTVVIDEDGDTKMLKDIK